MIEKFLWCGAEKLNQLLSGRDEWVGELRPTKDYHGAIEWSIVVMSSLDI